jgi:hypothetical protein
MSVPGLYHHVRTREQLVELAIEYSMRQLLEAAPENGSFLDDLLRYAFGLYQILSKHPEIIGNIAAGRFTLSETMARYQLKLIRRGVTSGFSPEEAYDVATRVFAAAIGAATTEASERAQVDQNSRYLHKLRDAVRTEEINDAEISSLLDKGTEIRDHFNTVILVAEALRARYGDRLDSLSAK